MQPSKNIASFQNLGTERYVCLDNKHLTVFIDIRQVDDNYISYLQYGKNTECLCSTNYESKTKKKAVLMAFDSIIEYYKDRFDLIKDIKCPDILKPYKLKINDSNDMEPLQLSLF